MPIPDTRTALAATLDDRPARRRASKNLGLPPSVRCSLGKVSMYGT